MESTVRDVRGRTLPLAERLGHGAEGMVNRVRDSPLAVKRLFLRGSRSHHAALLDERLRAVARMPIEDLPVARPLVMLAEPEIGYVMELLDDMVPLEKQMLPPYEVELISWYLATGGLRRRLRVLARLATTLAALHARGMVYGDPSPGNVLVSEPLDQDQIWLVDPDNLAVESDGSRPAVYTPGYGAPELVSRGSRTSTLSDAFAFAVLAHHTLFVAHPFIGDDIEDGPVELEEAAHTYRVPWIDHSHDRSNASTMGLPGRDRLLTRTLSGYFRATFEDGLRAPVRRPSCADWATALWQAVDATLTCRSCRGHRFAARACPWCGTPPGNDLVCRVWLHAGPDIFSLARASDAPDPERVMGAQGWSIPAGEIVAIDSGRPFELTARHGEIRSDDPHRPLSTVSWDGGRRVRVTNVGVRPLLLVSGDRQVHRRLPPGRDAEVELRPDVPPWRLCFTSDPLSPHRQVTFDVVGPAGAVR
jgi:DNA-binding helix-hairpin-helix protein with protein kinase domain